MEGSEWKNRWKRLLETGSERGEIAKRFGKHPSTILVLDVAKHGLQANNRLRHVAKGGHRSATRGWR